MKSKRKYTTSYYCDFCKHSFSKAIDCRMHEKDCHKKPKKPLNLKGKSINYFVGKLISEYREDKKLSQQELGNLTGMDRSSIAKIERGKQNVSLFQLQKISKALNIEFSIKAETIERLQNDN